MQQLTAPPRDSLTADQVMWLLVGCANPHYDRGLDLLDSSLNVVADLTEWFQGGTVTHTANAIVHGTCSLVLAGDARAIDYGTQLLRPYMTISDDPIAPSVTAKFYAGVFRPSRPSVDNTTSPGTLTITGADRLALLNRPVGDAYTLAAGTGYLDGVEQIWSDAGLDPATLLLDGSARGTVLPTAKSWPQLVDTSSTDAAPPDAVAGQSNATTWLQMINDLLEAVGYRGIYCTENGFGKSEPYTPASQRAVEFVFDFDDLTTTIIAPDRSDATDQSSIVNVWIFQQQNLVDGSGKSIEPVEGAGQYTVRNQSTGPTSIDAQGGIEWISIIPVDAADQASLEASGDQTVAAALAATRTFTVNTRPFPVALHRDVYTYADLAVVGGVVKVEEQSWTLDFGNSTGLPANMQRSWASVADIEPVDDESSSSSSSSSS